MSKSKAKPVEKKRKDGGWKGLVLPPDWKLCAHWKRDALLIGLIIILAFSVRYVGLTANGVTSDEPAYVFNGAIYIDNLVHGNVSAQAWGGNIEHPPISKYVYGLATWPFYGTDNTIEGLFFNAKLASALMGTLTCVFVYILGREFFSREAGMVAAMILSLIPTFVAHTQIAALESPLALFVTLTILLYLMAVKYDSHRLFVASAFAMGLSLSTKYNALLVLPVLGLFFLYYRLREPLAPALGLIVEAIKGGLHNLASRLLDAMAKAVDMSVKAVRADWKRLVPVESLFIFLGLSLVMLFVLWPLLWTGPIDHLAYSLRHWTYDITEYFLGTRMAPPIYYYPVYFLVTLPALLFIPLALGVYDTVKTRDAFKVAILLWFIVPFGYNLSSFIQDGMRYIFMIYPAVALLCAFGLLSLAKWVTRTAGARFKSVTVPRALLALTAVVVVYLLVTVAAFYPYYLDYYNEFTGGPKNVQEHRLFKFGWWGEGIKECMEWVHTDGSEDDQVMMFTLPEDPANTWYYATGEFFMYPWLGSHNGTDQTYTFSEKPYLLYYNERNWSVVPNYIIINQKMMEDYNVTIDDPFYTIVYNATVRGAPVCQVYKRI